MAAPFRSVRGVTEIPQAALMPSPGLIRRVSGSDGSIEDWSRLNGADGAYGDLAWSPDGRHLAVYCPDALVILA